MTHIACGDQRQGQRADGQKLAGHVATHAYGLVNLSWRGPASCKRVALRPRWLMVQPSWRSVHQIANGSLSACVGHHASVPYCTNRGQRCCERAHGGASITRNKSNVAVASFAPSPSHAAPDPARRTQPNCSSAASMTQVSSDSGGSLYSGGASAPRRPGAARD